MRPVDYVYEELRRKRLLTDRRRGLPDLRYREAWAKILGGQPQPPLFTPPTYASIPKSGTAPPPQLKLPEAPPVNVSLPEWVPTGPGVMLGLWETTGGPTLYRIIKALATGRPLSEVEREYFERFVPKQTPYGATVTTPEKLQREAELSSIAAAAVLIPLGVYQAGRELPKLLARFAAGGAATSIPLTGVAAAQGRPPQEVGQIALESFLAGGVVGGAAAALWSRLRSAAAGARTFSEAVDRLRQAGVKLRDDVVDFFRKLYDEELHKYEREWLARDVDEVRAEIKRLEELLEKYYIKKEAPPPDSVPPRYVIEDRLEVLRNVLKTKEAFEFTTGTIQRLAKAAETQPFGPGGRTVRLEPAVRDVLAKINKARTVEDLAKIQPEIEGLPDEFKQFLENAIQKRWRAIQKTDLRAQIENAKTPEELEALKQKLAELEKRLDPGEFEELQKLLFTKREMLTRGVKEPAGAGQPPGGRQAPKPPERGSRGGGGGGAGGGEDVVEVDVGGQKMLVRVRREARAEPKGRAEVRPERRVETKAAPEVRTEVRQEPKPAMREGDVSGQRPSADNKAKTEPSVKSEVETEPRTEPSVKTDVKTEVKTAAETRTTTAETRTTTATSTALYSVLRLVERLPWPWPQLLQMPQDLVLQILSMPLAAVGRLLGWPLPPGASPRETLGDYLGRRFGAGWERGVLARQREEWTLI